MESIKRHFSALYFGCQTIVEKKKKFFESGAISSFTIFSVTVNFTNIFRAKVFAQLIPYDFMAITLCKMCQNVLANSKVVI